MVFFSIPIDGTIMGTVIEVRDNGITPEREKEMKEGHYLISYSKLFLKDVILPPPNFWEEDKDVGFGLGVVDCWQKVDDLKDLKPGDRVACSNVDEMMGDYRERVDGNLMEYRYWENGRTGRVEKISNEQEQELKRDKMERRRSG